jgi:formylglycine-generating enzyme required for sulfatase activity
MMGSDAGEENEQPVHRVVVTKPFELQDTEVTQAEWDAVMEKNPSHFRGPNKPVDSVSWHEVHEFIRRLNLRNGGYAYRLPTEAEWEYAARAGAGPERAEDIGAVGYHTGNSNLQSHPVRSLPPNAWGLYDMRGNVWEWVDDVFDRYSRNSSADPTGPVRGRLRTMRGGGWHSTVDALRSTFRLGADPEFRNSALGFRLARTGKG